MKYHVQNHPVFTMLYHMAQCVCTDKLQHYLLSDAHILKNQIRSHLAIAFLIHRHFTLSQPHFNTGEAVTLRYNNTHTPVRRKHLFSLSQISTNNTLQVQSCVFRSDNLLKQICFLICRDKWLSFISPSLHPGLLALGTPLGAAQGLCFGSTLGDVTGRPPRRSPGHLSAPAQKAAAVAAHPGHNRDHRQPDHREGSWVPIWRDPLSANTGPVSRPEGRAVRQALTHQEVEGENKALMNHPGGEIQ